jgi:NAD(P)-dependent dehydrogenase (short-subunit alcohol dehydrogenase family)
MARLNETVVIVTGAGQGIGATYAKALAAEGRTGEPM